LVDFKSWDADVLDEAQGATDEVYGEGDCLGVKYGGERGTGRGSMVTMDVLGRGW